MKRLLAPPFPTPLASATFAIALAVALPSQAGGDANAGRLKAQTTCSVCHGPNGVAVMPSAANLAGQAPEYVAAQLQNFRSGKRQHEVMSVIAAPLKDDEIENLAAWYGSIQVEVKVPPAK